MSSKTPPGISGGGWGDNGGGGGGGGGNKLDIDLEVSGAAST